MQKGVESHRQDEEQVRRRPVGPTLRGALQDLRAAQAPTPSGCRATSFEHAAPSPCSRRIEQIYRYPLAPDGHGHAQPPTAQRHTDEALAELVVDLYEEDSLCLVQEEERAPGAAHHLFAGAVDAAQEEETSAMTL